MVAMPITSVMQIQSTQKMESRITWRKLQLSAKRDAKTQSPVVLGSSSRTIRTVMRFVVSMLIL